MKLRTKIQLSFSVTFIVILVVVGIMINSTMNSSTTSMLNDSMTTSATLASNHISQQLKDYMNVVLLLGENDIFAGKKSAEEKMEYLDSYIKTYGFTSANILDTSGVSLNDGTDFSDREYVKQALDGKTNVSDITLSKYTNTYGVSIAAPTYDADKKINGVVYFRLDIDFISEIIDSISISKNSYAYLIDANGNIVVHPNEKLILNYNMTEQKGTIKTTADGILKGKSGNGNYIYKNKEILCGYSPVDNTNGWSMVIAAPKSDFAKTTQKLGNTLVALGIIAMVVVFIVAIFIARSICNPINRVKEALVSLAKGDFGTEIASSDGKDEIAVLQNTASSLVQTLSDIIGQSDKVLSSIANYDLTIEDMKEYPGEFNHLSTSVNSIKFTLNQLIKEVQNAVLNVDTGSRELAQATSALSQGTVSQANSIQTLADNLSIIVENINRNSEREEQVNNNLDSLDKQIQEANAQMQELLAAVDNIEKMSSNIQKIVGTIDSIAFQTNILSLNASVEAARAGDMGSGFAVVAEEVRALAEKCSESSKLTNDLISECINSISNAKVCADSTFEGLSAIVENSASIASTFKEISEDTQEQANKSNNIQEEVNMISDVVQTNTATVEETAASTAELSDQAMNLENMVRGFKVIK